MADKKKPGDGLRYPASTWNEFCDAAEDYKRRALGGGGNVLQTSWPTDKIKIKNASGSARQRGEILKIGSALYTPLTANTLPDLHPRNFAFSGSQITAVTEQFCVLTDWAATNQVVEAQVSGIVGAMVDIADANHEYATLEATSYTLVSVASGPHRIVAKPSGTGDKACVVNLFGTAKTRLWRFTLNESLADGTASSDLLTMSGTDTGFDVTINDPLGIFAALTAGTEAGLCLEQDGLFYVIQAVCP